MRAWDESQVTADRNRNIATLQTWCGGFGREERSVIRRVTILI